MNSRVSAYLKKAAAWREEMEHLRALLLSGPLTEELKWGKPCYTFQKSNVAIIISMKECCALMFCKGALLKDAAGLLSRPGEHTQAGRWMKFTSVRQIEERAAKVRSYLQEAIEVEKTGVEVEYKKTEDYAVPPELQSQLDESPAFRAAFEALTPGRQRGYLLHFAAAKQAKTRTARVEKCRPRILTGKGLNDR